MGKLAIRVGPPPPPYLQLFVIILGFRLTLDYDYIWSKIDFTQEKIIFIQLLETPIPPNCCCSVTKWYSSGVIATIV